MKFVKNDFAKTAIFVSSQVDDAMLTPVEFRIYCHIARRAGGGCAFPSAESMARVCRVNRKSVFLALKTLLRFGMIHKSTRLGTSSVYHLTMPESWTLPANQDIQTDQGEIGPVYQSGLTAGIQSGLTAGIQSGLTGVPDRSPLRVSTEVTPLKSIHLRESSSLVENGKKPRQKMKRPTLEEWTEQAKSIKPWWPTKDIHKVHDHYEANGWKQSNGNPIVNWQAAQRTCYRNWETQNPRAEYDYRQSQRQHPPERDDEAIVHQSSIFGALHVA